MEKAWRRVAEEGGSSVAIDTIRRIIGIISGLDYVEHTYLVRTSGKMATGMSSSVLLGGVASTSVRGSSTGTGTYGV